MIPSLLSGIATGIIIASKAGYATAASAFILISTTGFFIISKSRPRHDFDDIIRCCIALLAGFIMGNTSVAIVDLSSIGSVAKLSGIEIGVEGSISWVYEGSSGTQLVIGKLRVDGIGRVGGKILIDCKYLDESLLHDIGPGYAVKARMAVALINGATNPGLFDARSYWFLKGVHVTGVSIREFSAVKGRAPFPTGLAWAFYKSFRGFTYAALRRWDEKALMDAIVLSDKSSMDEVTVNEFAEGGIAHVMSASGLHLSVVMAAVSWALSRFGAGASLKAGMTAVFLPIYAMAAGMRPSIVRAMLMGMVSMVLPRIGVKRARFSYVTALACAVQLMLSPLSLFDKGFQMSYVAIAGLAASAWFQRARKSERLFDKASSYVLNSLLVSSVITAALIPIITTFHGRMGLLSPVANLVAIPAASLALTIGLTSFSMNLVWPWLGRAFMQVSRPFLSVLQRTASILGSSNVTSVPTGIGPGIHTVFYCLVLTAGLLSFSGAISIRRAVKTCYVKRAYIVATALLLVVMVSMMPCELLTVRILSVGQGDCSLLTLGRKFAMLIDTGPSYGSTSAMETRILPSLRYMGINSIDVLMLTHGHLDHTSGLDSLSRSINIGCTIVPAGDKVAEQSAMEAGLSPIGLIRGSSITAGDIRIDVLNPLKEIKEGDDLNEASMVVMLTYKSDTILLEADAGRGFESGYGNGLADAIKVGHHGAATSASVDLLETTSPSIAVISVGKNNYGHPSLGTITRIESIGADVFRTDSDGMVELYTKGHGVTARARKYTWNGAPFFRYL